jgi:hypothetical protein
MPRANVQKSSHIFTDDTGRFVVEPSLGAPAVGIDYALPVYADLGSQIVQVQQERQGAALLTTGQASVSTVVQIIAARPTRRSALVTNTDASVSVYVGNAAVSSSTGQLIKAGNSLTIPFTGAIYCVATTGRVVVTFAEAYD